ncbi:MAG: glycosyltransferase family protein [Bacteroidota bacterium]
MAKCVLIVQGEGRGHMSQSMALTEYLEEAGYTVEAVYVGCGIRESIPGYFGEFFKERLKLFYSPYFLRTPNKKGIYVGRTLLFNLVWSMRYLREMRRIRSEINALEPDVVFNFYDVVGALALKGVKPGIKRVGIGHHFFLHLIGYRCNRGSAWHRWLLKMHTTLVMKSCDRVLALSFRELKGDSSIDVVPPLVRRNFREITHQSGDRFLVYLLNEGYIFDLIRLSREDPDFQADVFTTLSPEISLPPGICIHPLNDERFREMMAACKGLITTSGFDTVAEAAYLGIPLVVVPSQHHFEQRCNAADVERSGIGIAVEQVVPGIQYEMKTFDYHAYRQWVDQAGDRILKYLKE